MDAKAARCILRLRAALEELGAVRCTRVRALRKRKATMSLEGPNLGVSGLGFGFLVELFMSLKKKWTEREREREGLVVVK